MRNIWKETEDDETVDAYINRLRNLSKRVSVDDKTLLYALLSGLRAPLASYVLGRNPQSFSEAVDAAQIAEFSAVNAPTQGDQVSTQLSEMRREIQQLAHRYDSMSLNAAIQSDRFTFANAAADTAPNKFSRYVSSLRLDG